MADLNIGVDSTAVAPATGFPGDGDSVLTEVFGFEVYKLYLFTNLNWNLYILRMWLKVGATPQWRY